MGYILAPEHLSKPSEHGSRSNEKAGKLFSCKSIDNHHLVYRSGLPLASSYKSEELVEAY
jgi:hypothetical protein